MSFVSHSHYKLRCVCTRRHAHTRSFAQPVLPLPRRRKNNGDFIVAYALQCSIPTGMLAIANTLMQQPNRNEKTIWPINYLMKEFHYFTSRTQVLHNNLFCCAIRLYFSIYQSLVFFILLTSVALHSARSAVVHCIRFALHGAGTQCRAVEQSNALHAPHSIFQQFFSFSIYQRHDYGVFSHFLPNRFSVCTFVAAVSFVRLPVSLPPPTFCFNFCIQRLLDVERVHFAVFGRGSAFSSPRRIFSSIACIAINTYVSFLNSLPSTNR